MTGFKRVKRGFRELLGSESAGPMKRGYDHLRVENLVDVPTLPEPTDPYFKYQWYLVSSEIYSTHYLLLHDNHLDSCNNYIIQGVPYY